MSTEPPRDPARLPDTDLRDARPLPTAASWPPNWARSVAFMVGLGLMCFEAVIDKSAHLIVYGPAFALTGLPLARGIDVLLDRLPGGKPRNGSS